MPTDKPTDLRAALVRGRSSLPSGDGQYDAGFRAALNFIERTVLPPGDEPVYAVTASALSDALKASEWGCSESSENGTHNDCYPDHGASEVLRELRP